MDVLSNWKPGMITVAMAAEMLNVSVPRVHQLITDKRLTPVVKVGQTYLLDREQVRQLGEIARPTGRPSKVAVEQRTRAALTQADIAGLADKNLNRPTKDQAQPTGRTRAAVTVSDIAGRADRNLGRKSAK